jgi:phage FluMu gp28-like protein
VRTGEVGKRLAFAYDCGRTRDGAEIAVFEVVGGRYLQRLMLTMRGIRFENQRAVIKAVFEQLPIKRGIFDRGGIGMDLHEWAEKRFGPTRAQGVDFDNLLKNEWATTLKRNMQGRKVTIVPDRDQDRQLHSIRRVANGQGKFTFEVEEDEVDSGGGKKVTHHADKFWTVAMGVWLCEEMDRRGGTPASDGERQAHEVNRQAASKGRISARPSSGRTLTRKGFGALER